MVFYIRNAIRTPDGTVLECFNRHDFKQHNDKISGEYYFNDGGEYYVRRSINKVPYEDLSVTTDHPFDEQRTYFMWTSWYDADMQPLDKPVRKPLKYLRTEHIEAILRTQKHIKGTHVEDLMRKELVYRQSNQEKE